MKPEKSIEQMALEFALNQKALSLAKSDAHARSTASRNKTCAVKKLIKEDITKHN